MPSGSCTRGVGWPSIRLVRTVRARSTRQSSLVSPTSIGLNYEAKVKGLRVRSCTNQILRYGGEVTAPGSPVEALAVLADEQRRRMFGFIRRARRPVTREEAAADAGISTKLAAFHLDKLVAAGLLRGATRVPAASGRSAANRRSTSSAEADIRVSIPERRPDLIAEILLDAVLDARNPARRPGPRRCARPASAARRSAPAERARIRPGRLGPERSLTLSEAMLERTRLRAGPHRADRDAAAQLPVPPARAAARPSWCAGSTTPTWAASSPAWRPPASRRSWRPDRGSAASSYARADPAGDRLAGRCAGQVGERADDGGVDQGADGDPDRRDRGQQRDGRRQDQHVDRGEGGVRAGLPPGRPGSRPPRRRPAADRSGSASCRSGSGARPAGWGVRERRSSMHCARAAQGLGMATASRSGAFAPAATPWPFPAPPAGLVLSLNANRAGLSRDRRRFQPSGDRHRYESGVGTTRVCRPPKPDAPRPTTARMRGLRCRWVSHSYGQCNSSESRMVVYATLADVR